MTCMTKQLKIRSRDRVQVALLAPKCRRDNQGNVKRLHDSPNEGGDQSLNMVGVGGGKGPQRLNKGLVI